MTNKLTFWTFFIYKRPLAWLMMLAILIMGTLSAITLPKEVQPEINLPLSLVSTALPGANPTDIETLITIPLEKEIASVANIKSLSSTSSFGFSSIVIEFEAEADHETATQDVK